MLYLLSLLILFSYIIAIFAGNVGILILLMAEILFLYIFALPEGVFFLFWTIIFSVLGIFWRIIFNGIDAPRKSNLVSLILCYLTVNICLFKYFEALKYSNIINFFEVNIMNLMITIYSIEHIFILGPLLIAIIIIHRIGKKQ